jgi:predicted HTH transcriptional regulator
MLNVIDLSISELLIFNNRTLNEKERLEYFISINKLEFTRKDYMNTFKDISSSTASRDLKNGVEMNVIEKIGSLNKTKYRIKTGYNNV